MSCYVKIRHWSGDDVDGAIACLAKMFKMADGEAGQVMRDIMENGNWQFQWTVSDEQAEVAQSHLRSQGFSMGLIHAEAAFGPDSVPPTQIAEEAPEKQHWWNKFMPKPKVPANPPAAPANPPAAEDKPARKSLFSFLSKKNR